MNRTSFSLGTTASLSLLIALFAAGIVSAEQPSEVRKRLKDPSPTVRKEAALTLAEANDADAIPVLIDLLTELPADERKSVEELLTALAGEWTPRLQFAADDEISRVIRRDAWASWWRHTDGPALLAIVGKHAMTPNKRRKVEKLITQLGSDDFKLREDASQQLLSFHRLILPRLREARKDRDAEVARRAKRLIERIEKKPVTPLPLAAMRLLAVRKPVGAVEALLAYLPFAEEEIREDEVRKSLIVLARRDGKLDPVLRRGLADASPKVRAVVAEALIEGGGADGRAAASKLLAKDEPSVRVRIGLALVWAGEREAVSVLIDLLPLLSQEEYRLVEDLLYQLAGDTTPKLPMGAESDDKKKRHDAWGAWWTLNARRVDMARLGARPWLGYTLLCDNRAGRVFEIDRQGKQRWAIDNVQNPLDAIVLPGNRVLIAENAANRVTERDFKGNILWQKRIDSPVNVQRLPNGHIFIAAHCGPIVELDRAGKEIYSIKITSASLLAAYRSHRGDIVCVTTGCQCLVLDTTGKQLKKFYCGHANMGSGLGLRPNGHILVAKGINGKVVEFDCDGKIVLELNAPDIATASHLPNGNILVASPGRSLYELDRAGRTVWEYKNTGHVYRARRR